MAPGENGDVFVFTFMAPAGGISNGGLTVAVPAGFSAPVTTNAPGCTTVSTGTLAVGGQTITVSSLTLAANATTTITYGASTGGSCGANGGATASSTVGNYTFTTQEKSTSGGTLTNLAASPTGKVQ